MPGKRRHRSPVEARSDRPEGQGTGQTTRRALPPSEILGLDDSGTARSGQKMVPLVVVEDPLTLRDEDLETGRGHPYICDGFPDPGLAKAEDPKQHFDSILPESDPDFLAQARVPQCLGDRHRSLRGDPNIVRHHVASLLGLELYRRGSDRSPCEPGDIPADAIAIQFSKSVCWGTWRFSTCPSAALREPILMEMEPTGEERLARIREVTDRALRYYATAYLTRTSEKST
jgi:hypothetical protein